MRRTARPWQVLILAILLLQGSAFAYWSPFTAGPAEMAMAHEMDMSPGHPCHEMNADEAASSHCYDRGCVFCGIASLPAAPALAQNVIPQDNLIILTSTAPPRFEQAVDPRPPKNLLHT